MKGMQVIVLSACVAYVVAGPLAGSGGVAAAEPSSHVQVTGGSSDSLIRPKRWILSWLLGHGALMDQIENRKNTSSNSSSSQQTDEASAIRHSDDTDEDSSAELVDKPGVIEVDLSRDTRVNYQDGQGRTGALAHESDAEVFDWTLVQEDRNRNAAGDAAANPHYYQSNAISGAGRSSSSSYGVEGNGASSASYGMEGNEAPSSSYGLNGRASSSSSSVDGRTASPSSYGVAGARSSSGYGGPQRTVSGILRNRSGLHTFNRFPIAYEESLQYQNLRRQRSPVRH